MKTNEYLFYEREGGYSVAMKGSNQQCGHLLIDKDGIFCGVCGQSHMAKKEKNVKQVSLFGYTISIFKKGLK